MYNSSSVCAVNYQSRSLCAQTACQDRHRFLVGSCSLHDNNELSVLEYTEDSNHFEAVAVYSHPDQIWAMESSPRDPALAITSRQNFNGSKSLTLWRLEKQSQEDIENSSSLYANDQLELEELDSFSPSQQAPTVDTIKWHQKEDVILTFDGKMLSTWTVQNDKVKSLGVTIVGEADEQNRILIANGSAAWDPHNATGCAAVSGRDIHLIDRRDMEVTGSRPTAHKGLIRSLDYNPNKPFTLATAGEDALIKVWDLRRLNQPILQCKGHSHWVTALRYNPYHDQLLLSGGTDQIVNLWRLASISSAAWLGGGELAEEENEPPDIKVRAMDQHEESIYSIAWSPAEAWIYCSLSCDGRAIVNHVPSTEKYKILL
eukprot:gene1438-1563_t